MASPPSPTPHAPHLFLSLWLQGAYLSFEGLSYFKIFPYVFQSTEVTIYGILCIFSKVLTMDIFSH